MAYANTVYACSCHKLYTKCPMNTQAANAAEAETEDVVRHVVILLVHAHTYSVREVDQHVCPWCHVSHQGTHLGTGKIN